ncbi:MAG: DUF5060 domain-containing protein, partial [Chloroflexi bacterium]
MIAQIEKWDSYECVLRDAEKGNPYLDVILEAEFQHQGHTVRVPGFYDG